MKTFTTHGVEYAERELLKIRERVERGVTATVAVKEVLPAIAENPVAVQAVVATARTKGFITFDRTVQRWIAPPMREREAQESRTFSGRSVYVDLDVWAAFKRKHGDASQRRIRELLAADLGA